MQQGDTGMSQTKGGSQETSVLQNKKKLSGSQHTHINQFDQMFLWCNVNVKNDQKMKSLKLSNY